MNPKVLLLDIETAPNTAYVWGLFKQNINISHIIGSGSVLCWAAKWLGNDEVMFDSVHKSGRKRMLRKIHKLLDQADAVIHYNGTRFDIPTLNKEFLEASIPPPAGYKQVDLLKTARKMFRFPSNKLDYVSKTLGLGQKASHEGFELWVKCMNKDGEAWSRMEEYNKQDVVLLEKLYNRFLPWIPGGLNMGIFTEELVCSRCGSHNVQKRGLAVTQIATYQRYQCQDCGGWSQERSASSTSVLKEA